MGRTKARARGKVEPLPPMLILAGVNKPICFECKVDRGEEVEGVVIEFGPEPASFCEAHIAEIEEIDGEPVVRIPRRA